MPAAPESTHSVCSLAFPPFDMTEMGQFCDHPGVVKFKPRAGDMLVWHNHAGDFDLDWMTLHGGCPPTVGADGTQEDKYIMQRWIRGYGAEGNQVNQLLGECGIFEDWHRT